MNGDTSNTRKLPWWVQTIITLGIMPSITIFLILVITGFIASPFTRSMQEQADEHKELIKVFYQAKREQIALLQVICLSIVDPRSRNDCIKIVPDGGPR